MKGTACATKCGELDDIYSPEGEDRKHPQIFLKAGRQPCTMSTLEMLQWRVRGSIIIRSCFGHRLDRRMMKRASWRAPRGPANARRRVQNRNSCNVPNQSMLVCKDDVTQSGLIVPLQLLRFSQLFSVLPFPCMLP
ncbi:hypothetical protein Mp_zg00200 [Marchantia polymorpha subsp. ruderalis]|uniref:Uncharacterized protein n=2 Tax=Marchantia polymorpha TaxID=3197 RepID=A0A679DXQ8_MARPO|nr:hypothetical protein MARPO_4299s0001 [Marchantia polymorpha]BBN20689.1 hypothetical protein Mp_zg00200 [Marchantia polymorpha subsp. ruderalis]|eukprot:PTQ26231.1 hypothetical protein MARPO_4299s0001 [Marchantia polymorpha]